MEIFLADLAGRETLRELTAAEGCGLETLQFGISENLDHLEETIRKEQKFLASLGNPSLTMHGPFLDLNPMSFDEKIRRATRERFEEAWQAAQILGAQKLIFHSGMIPGIHFTEGWAQRSADFWREFMDGKAGITVCVENVLDREPGPLAELADRVDHPDFGLCLDIGHASCYSAFSPEEWVRTLGNRVRHVHLHDNDGTRDTHGALGSGVIPWESCLRELIRKNPDLTGTIECSRREELLASVRLLREKSF